jgi:hypothetical protein
MISTDISPAFKGATAAESTIVEQLLRLDGTPKAIQYFIDNHHKLGDYHYWFLLSTLWVQGSEGADLGMWRLLFSSDRANKQESLMKPSECDILYSLSDKMVAFRAHRPGEWDWISYTLNHRVAVKFAIQYGIRQIESYWVNSADITALFTRRGEYEILVLDKSRAVRHKTIQLQFAE